MDTNFIDTLKSLGIAKFEDGYEASIKVMCEFEKKYNISSVKFYNAYNSNNLPENINLDDRATWIFNCDCFISCGGDFSTFELEQQLDSLMTQANYKFDINDSIALENDINCVKGRLEDLPLFYIGLQMI